MSSTDADHTDPRPPSPAGDASGATLSILPPSPDTLVGPGPGHGLAPGRFDIPGYKVLNELGRGGMGVVYLARQLGLERTVALKMVLSGRYASEGERRRFRIEAEAIARLEHPGVVRIYDVGEHEGTLYFSLEYCPGGSLADRLADAALPPTEAARVVEQLARSVAAAHAAGVLHRDIKPANVLFAADGTPRLTDFGLARRLDEAGQTTAGLVMGTPCYMSPEQAQGQPDQLGPATDIYALGAVLYECLTGRPPFKAASVVDTLHQVVNEDPVAPSRLLGRAPRDLETVCLKCLRKEPGQRYASAADLADDLRAYLDGKPIRARATGPIERLVKWARRRPAVAGLLAALAVLTTVSFALITWSWLEAARARDEARRESTRATQQLDRAEEALYFNRIALADREWHANNPRAAREILALCPARLRGWEWSYLDRASRGGLADLTGHRGRVSCLAAAPDREHVASGGHDGTVRLWHLASGRTVRVLEGNVPHALGLAYSADGKRLAVACGDGVIRLWQLPSGQRLFHLRGHRGSVADVAFHPAGRLLASAGEDEVIRLWDLDTGKQVGQLQGHTNAVTRLAFDAMGKRLASASYDNLVILWDVDGRKELRRCEGHRDGVSGVVFTPDGQRLVSCGGDRTLRLWEAATGKPEQVLRGHTDGVNEVACSPDGARLVSSSQDGSLRVWEADTGKLLLTLCGHTGPVHAGLITPDSRWVVSAGADGLVKVWDAHHAPTARVLTDSVGPITAVAVAADGRTCLSVASDGKVRARDLRTRLPLFTLQLAGVPLTGLALSPADGTIATVAWDRTIRLWDAKGQRERARLSGHRGTILAVAFSPDGQRLVSAGHDEQIKLWDVRTGKELHSWAGHADIVRAVAFNREGTLLATAGDDRKVRLWDVSTREERAVLEIPAGQVTSLAFAPGGEPLAAGTQGGQVLLWRDVLEEPHIVRGHGGTVHQVTFSPDGRRLLSASADRTVKVWEPASGQQVLSLRGHDGPVLCVACSPDGQTVVSGADDQTLRLWAAGP